MEEECWMYMLCTRTTGGQWAVSCIQCIETD
jgi:hypothetical protein